MGLLKSFKPLAKKSLSGINKFLDASYVPQSSKIRYFKQFTYNSPLLNPHLIIKKTLNGTNKLLINWNSKPRKNKYWAVGILGLISGFLMSHIEQIDQWIGEDTFENRIQKKMQAINQQAHDRTATILSQKILENPAVINALVSLIKGICLSEQIQHNTTENIDKVIEGDLVTSNSIKLTNQLILNLLTKSAAEEALKNITVGVLRQPYIRGQLERLIMDFFRGEYFQKTIVNKQLAGLLRGKAYLNLISSGARSTIKSNLKNEQNKKAVYKYLFQYFK